MLIEIPTPRPREILIGQNSRSRQTNSEDRSGKMLWLDKNECADPEYIHIIEEVVSSIPITALYGYPNLYELYSKLSDNLGVEMDQLLLAAGSDSVIRAVFDAYVSPGDVVIHPEPTFLMYSVYSKLYGAKSVVLDYSPSSDGPLLLSQTFINAIRKYKPRLVCLPNPGSPTGTVFSSNEMLHIIEEAGEAGAIILVDEAYYPFYPQTVLHLVDTYSHLLVARTFSKAWGLAGIRLGYGIACRELIQSLYSVRPRYEVGSLSAAIAFKILDYSDAMQVSVGRLNKGKKYFINEMTKLGFKTLSSEGNFLHVAFGEYSDRIHFALKDKVFYQKNFKHPALVGYSRFTTTTVGLFSQIIDLISEVIN